MVRHYSVTPTGTFASFSGGELIFLATSDGYGRQDFEGHQSVCYKPKHETDELYCRQTQLFWTVQFYWNDSNIPRRKKHWDIVYTRTISHGAILYPRTFASFLDWELIFSNHCREAFELFRFTKIFQYSRAWETLFTQDWFRMGQYYIRGHLQFLLDWELIFPDHCREAQFLELFRFRCPETLRQWYARLISHGAVLYPRPFKTGVRKMVLFSLILCIIQVGVVAVGLLS